MKNSLIASGAVLLGLNAAAVYLPEQNLTLAAQTASAAIGMVLVFLAIRPQPKQKLETTAPAKPATPPPRAEAEIVAFLALLQEHGRLVDFAKEDITAASDGANRRNVCLRATSGWLFCQLHASPIHSFGLPYIR